MHSSQRVNLINNIKHRLDRRTISYVLAVLLPLPVLALIAHLPWSIANSPFLLPLMAPIIVAALLGGLGPGLLATFISGAGAAWIVPPTGSFTIAIDVNLFRWSLLVGNGLLVTFLAEKFLRSKAAKAVADARMQESRQQFEATFQQAAVGMAIIATDGKCLRANLKLAEILGYSEQQLLGKTFQEFTHPDDLKAVREQRARLLAHAVDNYSIEQRCFRRDGTVLWVNVTASLVRQAAGMPIKILTVVEDISARKRAENALKAALEVARDANSANLAKSSFLANMSHEIRTPLNAILGTTQLLQGTELTPAQRELLAMQEKAGKHLLAIISDILDLSRIEAGKFDLAEDTIHLHRLVEHAVDMVRTAATAKGLTLIVEMETRSGQLLGDATCLRQALLNYLSNAVKFTHAGTIAVRAFAVEEDAQSILCRFEVQDTGIGITPDNLARLFAAFEQADSRISRKYGGTGLGLVITRRLATLMGGTADACSTPAGGSTFWFTARLRKAGGHAFMPGLSAEKTAAPAALRDISGCRVLAIDDDPVNLQLLEFMINNMGGDVDVANGGRLALEMAAAKRYDIVLLDLHMPEQSGIETVQQMRLLPGYHQIPIIAVTASALAEDKEQALAAGFNDFMTKPVEMTALAQALRKWTS